ncbi:PREDICTED: FBD-associated F-box protein At5g38590-like [Camelina sativa]|uniref:FBD-associated F-box protein At5g38590-like n=1 Tax=Camelina sativa TaxID=90675 RepID=A0ABM1QR72_CAMSA|nr:PREDICTED: FBD-associated F-box protein At5g38590-like [Camelina sativa]
MDVISALHDDLLVKILLFLPTKKAVSTSILSKRWEFLWMWLPKLHYKTKRGLINYSNRGLPSFIDKKLPLHRAPVIESLCLNLFGKDIKPKYIRKWVEIVVSRHVRELEISYNLANGNIFPSSLFSCKSLVILKLKEMVLMDVPSTVCLPSLRTLQLEDVKLADEKSLQELLSMCHVLEDLSVLLYEGNDIKEFTIIVPSLQSLWIFIAKNLHVDGYVIDTPSLNYLKLEDWNYFQHHCFIKNMPKLREAFVSVFEFPDLKCLIRSIRFVKRLRICSQDVYGDGFVFNQLEHLNLCVCKEDSLNLLGQLLKDSPNLRVLNMFLDEEHEDDQEHDCMVCWNQPSPVPKCLLSSLQIFNWSGYLGTPQERDIVVYILENACHLKVVTISFPPSLFLTLDMLKELAFSPRASTTCQLVLN